ncbi:MAG TPA: RpiB/LacA/LacB family sugar-phosphate isomerase [Candidatus Paceibacterota bacterium]|nr:RpiB/LacA/LacB family sugar-phosphate isomerase [Candidatus Paceibacterota bacterium]
MKVLLASDHAGFALKAVFLEHLPLLGHEVEDMGAFELDPVDDYPDFVRPLAERVAREEGTFGIILGGSGQGEAMCANRVPGVRAAVFYGKMRVTSALDSEGGFSEDGFDAVRLPRRHNDANVLSIGARFVSAVEAEEAVSVFLATEFKEDEERHRRRIEKLG